MKQPKYDRKITRALFKGLDSLQRKHGAAETRYAATKWLNTQRDRQRIQKRRLQLRRELAEVNRALR